MSKLELDIFVKPDADYKGNGAELLCHPKDFEKFKTWLKETCELRDLYEEHLKERKQIGELEGE